MIKYYTGNIEPEEGTIFVFGSNPEGRHGAGAAKVAVTKFGAIYGQGEGRQGNSYAIPTKDLRVKGDRSISPDSIVSSIVNFYNYAYQHPDLKFKIAYRNTTEKSLNGYTGIEMIAMFIYASLAIGIPENVYISKEWFDTGLFYDR